MSLEVAIPFKNVELFGRFVLVVASERPGTSVRGGVRRCEIQRPQSNANVKVSEAELDGREYFKTLKSAGDIHGFGKAERKLIRSTIVGVRICAGQKAQASGAVAVQYMA